MRHPEIYTQPALESYLKLNCGQFDIIGRSIAGVETVLTVPQFGITFDTGRGPSFAVHKPWLALTHFHPDHAGGLGFYLGLRCLQGCEPLKIVVPEDKLAAAEAYLQQLKSLTESQLHWELLSAKEPVVLGKGLTLRGLPSFHSTASTGYLIERKRQRLLPEFAGCSESEIVAVRNSGRSVQEEYRVPVLAVSGDTMAGFFETEAVLADAFIMECTFFAEDMARDGLKNYGHTHILDWRDNADKLQSRTVVMTHTSQRYSLAEIEAACRKHLPATLLDRLVIFRCA